MVSRRVYNKKVNPNIEKNITNLCKVADMTVTAWRAM